MSNRDDHGVASRSVDSHPARAGSEIGWVSRAVDGLARAWGRGEQATAAEVLDRRPHIEAEAAVRLIFEEACLRREAGLAVDTTEIVRRYPRWATELRDLFECDRLLRPSGAMVDFPETGGQLGPFRLLVELGRGASGRTFLATDPTLADRPVVVKVVSDDQDEHLALARLRHTHIVPLFSEHAFPERGLRVLCMPYLGGTTLAQILGDLADVPPERRSGRSLIDALARHARPIPDAPPAEGPFRRGLEGASYVRAITWIAACLADALHYAHERGIVHMDLKPSNVLLTADGQPMLLDFHLARGPLAAGRRVAGRLGGTPGWMAPEQSAAMAAAAEGRPVPTGVDGRSDIFALGLLIQNALLIPDASRPPGVSTGLADIVQKCLAPDPRDRYPDAAVLAGDLRRQLDDLPLRGVRNRDPVERWRKWRRRHPGAVAWGMAGLSILVAAAVGIAAGVVAYRQRVDQVHAALRDGRSYQAAGNYVEAINAIQSGLDRAGGLPASRGLREALQRQLVIAQRGQLAEELHRLADLVRFRHGIDLPAHEDARTLLGLCRAIWGRKDRLEAPDGLSNASETERRIRSDLLELVAISVDLLRQLAPAEGRDDARREALRMIDEAEVSFGPSVALDARRAGLVDEPASISEPPGPGRAPRTAWEHYDLGRFLLRSGRVGSAAAEFDRALALRPQDFWSNYYSGLCAFRIGKFEAAVASFHTCLALEPEAAVCYYNRGLAREGLGRADEASSDYTRALEFDPSLAAAFLNRGILSYKQGRHAEAEADFERGTQARADRVTLGRIHYNRALLRLARGDRPSARRYAEQAVALGNVEAKALGPQLR